MQSKKPKKSYSLYRQGVNDAIDVASSVLLNEIFSSDPRANRHDAEEKVKYLCNKLKKIIE